MTARSTQAPRCSSAAPLPNATFVSFTVPYFCEDRRLARFSAIILTSTRRGTGSRGRAQLDPRVLQAASSHSSWIGSILAKLTMKF